MKLSLVRILHILIYLNIIVQWFIYFKYPRNIYINFESMVLASLLSFQIVLFLIYSKRKNNPLLLILSIQIFVFYIFRITTLLITSFSNVFLRLSNVDYNDCNHTLLYIIFSNIFLFFGIYFAGNCKRTVLVDYPSSRQNVNKVIPIILFTYVLSFSDFFNIVSLSILVGYLKSLFLNPYTIIFICILYTLSYYKLISKFIKFIILSLIVLFVIFVTLNGSRSGILTIAIYFIITLIAIGKKIEFKVSHLSIILLFIPISLTLFHLSTFYRSNSFGSNYSEKIEIAKNLDYKTILSFDLKSYKDVYDRIGFFDYATEIIAHKNQYSKYFDFQYYLKSIIDNVLSPGFNVFNTPKISLSLQFKYNYLGTESINYLTNNYQSDQLTIYGEFYSLFFGYGSLVIFFITGFVFQNIYIMKNKLNNIQGIIQKGFVLLLFYTLINSFGLDWFLFDIIGVYFVYFLFNKLVIKMN